MKMLSLIVVLTLLWTTGCHLGSVQVKGSGKRVVEKRQVSSFTSISTEGAFNVEIVCQKDLSLEVEADDNLLPLLKSEVSGNVLKLSSKGNFSTSDPITFKISVPNLEALNVNGAGKMAITGIDNEQFEIEANGAAAIAATGATKLINIKTNGAAKIDTHNLRSARAAVDSTGVSKVDLGVCDQLDVTVSGPSQVTYRGNPAVNKTVHGPGKVEKRGDEGA